MMLFASLISATLVDPKAASIPRIADMVVDLFLTGFASPQPQGGLRRPAGEGRLAEAERQPVDGLSAAIPHTSLRHRG